MVTVVQVGEDDWERIRDVRLDALRADPQAFGSSIERELAFKEMHWRMRARSSPWFLAVDGGAVIGLVCAIHEPGAPDDNRHVVGMWVRPEHRDRGVGRELVEAVAAWASQDGARTLSLWLLDGNDPGAALYRRCGFEPTGERTPLPRDPTLTEHRWERVLSPERAP
jgi:GNAT superfamily N-acetyltransferase